MNMLLAALGMLACLAIMAVLMPLGMRLVDRLRRPGASQAQGDTPAVPQQPRNPAPPQQPPRERR